MDAMSRVALLIITGLVLLIVVRQHSSATAPALSICITAAVIVLLLPQISSLVFLCKSLTELSGLDKEMFMPVIKTLGICVISKIIGEMSKDAGEGALGAKIEMAGSVIGLACVLPLLEKALRIISAI